MSAVGVLGLGGMGSRMAKRLVDAGHEVIVWNRSKDKVAGLVEKGASAAPTPAEAARRSEVLLTCVADPTALAAITEGADGLVAGLGAGSTVIEMSTVGRDAILHLASLLPSGARLLDAPVLGSLHEAQTGTLKIFVGGASQQVEQVRPLLSELGSPVHVGALGSGAAAKLVANLVLFCVLGTLGEALALAAGLGLDQSVAFAVLDATPIAAQAQRRRAAIETRVFDLHFPLELACKDAGLIAAAAAAAGSELRLALAAQSWIADAERAGLGAADYASVVLEILKGTDRGPTRR